MKILPIRNLRSRNGWTQMDLAEILGVDQGTVSRWERGIETPRPATAAALRDLIMKEDDHTAKRRFLATLRHSVLPACYIDGKTRLQFINGALVRYSKQSDVRLENHLGYEFERHATVIGKAYAWEAFRESRFLTGELLLARFYFNTKGKGHVTQYDPVFEQGKLVGLSATLLGTFRLPENRDTTLERVEVVHADKPDEIIDFFRGPLAEAALLS